MLVFFEVPIELGNLAGGRSLSVGGGLFFQFFFQGSPDKRVISGGLLIRAKTPRLLS